MADYYESEETPNSGDDKANIVHNQPYDESVDVSDGEEVASTTATPRGGAGNEQHPAANGYSYSAQQQQPGQSDAPPPPGPTGASQTSGGVVGRQGRMQFEEEEDDSGEEQTESEESEELEDGPHATLSGMYDPAEFQHLQVSNELKELFQHITRYTPQTIDLETKLKPFIPEYIPAIGDIDAFLKVVHNISDPEKQPKALENWIENISDLHRQKPAANVHYTKNMPDVENLMQEWQPQFEETLREVGLPTADIDCDLAQYADIVCGLLDIPVYKSRIHSLHVLFSLYMEFKNSQHFKSLSEDKQQLPDKPSSTSDSVAPED